MDASVSESPATPPPVIEAPHPAWQGRLRLFLAEFVVVVSGILVALALALGSWADDRRDQQRERDYPPHLEVDLASSGKS